MTSYFNYSVFIVFCSKGRRNLILKIYRFYWVLFCLKLLTSYFKRLC